MLDVATVDTDRADYFAAIAELGFTPEQVRSIATSAHDLMDFPKGDDARVQTKPSPIEGIGLFSVGAHEKNTLLAPARLRGKRTPAGRFTNHAKFPNCRFLVDLNGDIFLVTNQFVADGEELTVDYRQAKKTSAMADAMLTFNLS